MINAITNEFRREGMECLGIIKPKIPGELMR